jgi:hypothetical protein
VNTVTTPRASRENFTTPTISPSKGVRKDCPYKKVECIEKKEKRDGVLMNLCAPVA